jgi:hypothetical protein
MKALPNEEIEHAKPKKHKKKHEALSAAQEMIKRSDIKVSNPLKIEEFRRTTSKYAEGVKVKEESF